MIIPQIERFASKFSFNADTFNVRLWEQAMQEMSAKADQATGNVWSFVLNTKLWNICQRRLSSWIRDWKTTGCFVWSKGNNGYVDLGATYQSYEYAGKRFYCSLQ